MLHRLLGGDPELARDQLLRLDCVEREGPMTDLLVLLTREYFSLFIFSYHVVEDLSRLFIKQSVSIPKEVRLLLFLGWMLIF